MYTKVVRENSGSMRLAKVAVEFAEFAEFESSAAASTTSNKRCEGLAIVCTIATKEY